MRVCKSELIASIPLLPLSSLRNFHSQKSLEKCSPDRENSLSVNLFPSISRRRKKKRKRCKSDQIQSSYYLQLHPFLSKKRDMPRNKVYVLPSSNHTVKETSVENLSKTDLSSRLSLCVESLAELGTALGEANSPVFA